MAISNSIRKTFNYILFQLKTVCLAILLICLGLPTLLIVFGPACLIRRLVFHVAKWTKPHLGKMLNFASAQHAQATSRATIVSYHVVEGRPNLKYIREQVQIALLQAKCPSTGEMLYPELKQNIAYWMGFPFWSPIPNFRIEDHVTLVKDKEHLISMDGPDGDDLIKSYSKSPWSKDQALWEIVIVPNVTSRSVSPGVNHAAIIIRFHHALMDAHSLLQLLNNVYSPKPVEFDPRTIVRTEEGPSEKRLRGCNFLRVIKSVVQSFTMPFKMSYDFVHATLNAKTSFPFISSEVKLSGELSFGSSEMLQNSDIKLVARKYGVTFSSVLMALISKGIRDMVLEKFGEIKDDISVHYVLSLPNRPKKLRNHSTSALVNLPLLETDPFLRLKRIHNQLEGIKKSSMPKAGRILSMLMGCQFAFVIKRLMRYSIESPVAVLTNIPWGSPLALFDHPIKDFNFAIGVGGSAALVFGYLSHPGGAKVTVSCDSSVLDSKDAQKIITSCLTELDVLTKTDYQQNFTDDKIIRLL